MDNKCFKYVGFLLQKTDTFGHAEKVNKRTFFSLKAQSNEIKKTHKLLNISSRISN